MQLSNCQGFGISKTRYSDSDSGSDSEGCLRFLSAGFTIYKLQDTADKINNWNMKLVTPNPPYEPLELDTHTHKHPKV